MRVTGIVSLMIAAAPTVASQVIHIPSEEMSMVNLCDFTALTSGWYVVNDGVMGGVSQGALEMLPTGSMLFSGNLSLENNGGFSSCRLDLEPTDLSDFDGITLRVRGDGRRYGFSIRAHGRFDWINHRSWFITTTEEWREIQIPFNEFRPEFRGRPVAQNPHLDTTAIQSIGFIIADGLEGSFWLEVERVAAYRAASE